MTEPLSITQTPFIEEMESDKEEEETETDKEIVETTEEQKERQRLIHVYLTSMMDNKDKQMEQNKTEICLRTSMEEELKPLTQGEYDEDEPFEENDNKGKWMTQFSYPTEEEENTLFIAFMTGNVENQKTWINARMNLARTQTNEKTRS
jgi:hypothetical protein